MQKSLASNFALGLSAVLLGSLSGCDDASRAAHLVVAGKSAAELIGDDTPVDWPQWRGSRQDGISSETGWSSQWPADGPPVRWRTNVGIGFSSVAVVEGRVYTMGHQPAVAAAQEAEEKNKRGQDTVWCLAADSGSPLWTHTYPCLLVDNLHEGGPAATPTVHDGRVYTLSKEGHLFCLDAQSGQVVWQRMLRDDLSVEMPEWGFSGSPLVDGDLVIVDGGRIAAYDRTTGEPVWRTEKFKPGYGTPVAFDFTMSGGGTERLVAVLNNEYLIVVRQRDGHEFARRKWTTQYATSACTPVVVDDLMFISTGYRRGCLLARLTSAGELETIYENREMCNHMNTSVLWDGHWYGFDGSSHRSRTATLTCMDVGTGEVRWAQPGLGCGSLMIAGGKLLCLSDDGELAVVEPNPRKYRESARAKILDGRCWTVPVLSGGHVYARDAEGDLVCVDLRATDEENR